MADPFAAFDVLGTGSRQAAPQPYGRKPSSYGNNGTMYGNRAPAPQQTGFGHRPSAYGAPAPQQAAPPQAPIASFNDLNPFGAPAPVQSTPMVRQPVAPTNMPAAQNYGITLNQFDPYSSSPQQLTTPVAKPVALDPYGSASSTAAAPDMSNFLAATSQAPSQPQPQPQRQPQPQPQPQPQRQPQPSAQQSARRRGSINSVLIRRASKLSKEGIISAAELQDVTQLVRAGHPAVQQAFAAYDGGDYAALSRTLRRLHLERVLPITTNPSASASAATATAAAPATAAAAPASMGFDDMFGLAAPAPAPASAAAPATTSFSGFDGFGGFGDDNDVPITTAPAVVLTPSPAPAAATAAPAFEPFDDGFGFGVANASTTAAAAPSGGGGFGGFGDDFGFGDDAGFFESTTPAPAPAPAAPSERVKAAAQASHRRRSSGTNAAAASATSATAAAAAASAERRRSSRGGAMAASAAAAAANAATAEEDAEEEETNELPPGLGVHRDLITGIIYERVTSKKIFKKWSKRFLSLSPRDLFLFRSEWDWRQDKDAASHTPLQPCMRLSKVTRKHEEPLAPGPSTVFSFKVIANDMSAVPEGSAAPCMFSPTLPFESVLKIGSPSKETARALHKIVSRHLEQLQRKAMQQRTQQTAKKPASAAAGGRYGRR